MKRIGDMTMLLRAYMVLRRHRSMDLNELRAALRANGTVTSAYKLWYLLGTENAKRFGIRKDDAQEYSVEHEIECPVVKIHRDQVTRIQKDDIVVPERKRPSADKRQARRAERAEEVLQFIKHANRAPSQLGPKEERSMYQFMSEHRKVDPEFERAVAPYVRRRKAAPKVEEQSTFASMSRNTGYKDDVELALQLAESGGAGFM